jgi:predicted nucleotidyltransferase
MNIDSKDTIAGQPIIKIRNLLNRGRACDGWTEDFVANSLRISLLKARKIIDVLEKQGYIEACRIPGNKNWKNTIYGNKLALASAAKPITRDTASKQLKQFLDRVVEVRDSKKYLYKVTHVIVFGSFLSKKQKLSDLDIWINLVPKNPKKMALMNKRNYVKAISDGKQTGNALSAAGQPRANVIKHLKYRSRVISLHINDPIVESCKHKVIYRDEDATIEMCPCCTTAAE